MPHAFIHAPAPATLIIVAAMLGCVTSNPAFDPDSDTEGVGDGDGDPGDGDPGDGDPGDGDPGDGDPGDGDGDSGDGDGEPGDGDGEPGDGDGEPGCNPPLTDCEGACVDLDSDPAHCGGCFESCIGVCEAGMCDESAERLVFLSSQPHTGMFNGLEGADEFCKGLASSAGLEGDFMAWLSTANLGPAARMNHFPGPYRLIDGTLVANGWADLTDGTLAHPIDRNEEGLPVAAVFVCEGSEVWTNTKPNGTPYSNADCNGWQEINATSMAGRHSEVDQTWTQSGCIQIGCGTPLPIYCVQQ